MSRSNLEGYSLGRRETSGGHLGVPMMSMNDWMNPMGMFPTAAMQQQNFYKGTPVRAPEATGRLSGSTGVTHTSSIRNTAPSEVRGESTGERHARKAPCSNVPSRALRRMQLFETRDWTTFQAPLQSVKPVDAELPSPSKTISAEANPSGLWQPSLLSQNSGRSQWAPSLVSQKSVSSLKRGVTAIGESDSDSGRDDNEAEHEQWMRELVATVNSVMRDHEIGDPSDSRSDTRNQYQFEWLHQAKRGGVNLHTN